MAIDVLELLQVIGERALGDRRQLFQTRNQFLECVRQQVINQGDPGLEIFNDRASSRSAEYSTDDRSGAAWVSGEFGVKCVEKPRAFFPRFVNFIGLDSLCQLLSQSVKLGEERKINRMAGNSCSKNVYGTGMGAADFFQAHRWANIMVGIEEGSEFRSKGISPDPMLLSCNNKLADSS
jgi:hypothetical protein